MKKDKKKRRILFLLMVIILLFVFSFLLFKRKTSSSVKNLENKMTEIVSSYYDKNIKGKIIGVHRQIVTLEDLQNQKYDIYDFINSNCSLDSFSYVVLEDPNEKDASKIKYTLEHHLDCK